jgi:DNA-binding response OmpR family regulator
MVPSLKKRSQRSVLVVDDDPNEMRSLVIGLKLEGFDVEGVDCGKVALERLETRSFSAVIIDLMMPEMNGLQLARAIRAQHAQTPTILMSAYHLSPVQLARADTGVVGFVPKPFAFEEFVSFLNCKIDPTRSGRADAANARTRGLHTPFDVASLTRGSSVPPPPEAATTK